MEKYLVRCDSEHAIGIKYDLKRKFLSIGGSFSNRETMEMILKVYFGLAKVPGLRQVSRTVIRYDLKMGLKIFRNGCLQLHGQGLIERVKAHGRIMR